MKIDRGGAMAAGLRTRQKEKTKETVRRGKIVAICWADGTMSICRTVRGVEWAYHRGTGRKIRKRKSPKVEIVYCDELANYKDVKLPER